MKVVVLTRNPEFEAVVGIWAAATTTSASRSNHPQASVSVLTKSGNPDPEESTYPPEERTCALGESTYPLGERKYPLEERTCTGRGGDLDCRGAPTEGRIPLR